MPSLNKENQQEDYLLAAIKSADKQNALELVKLADQGDVKPHHLKAAIKEYHQESNNFISSIVRSTEGLIVKALAEKSSDEALLNNRHYVRKEAVYEYSDDGMPSWDLVKGAKIVEVKAVADELKKRGLEKAAAPGHADAVAQRSTKSHER